MTQRWFQNHLVSYWVQSLPLPNLSWGNLRYVLVFESLDKINQLKSPNIYIYIHRYTHTCVFTYTYIRMYIRTHIHVYIHKNTWNIQDSYMAKRIKGCTNHHRYGYFWGIRKQQRGFLYHMPIFWPHSVACGISVPQPGIKPCLWSVESYHWTATEVATFCS